MSQVRLNFLNWRPDSIDLGNEGLSIANNVLHDTEGYKPLVKQTAAAFTASTFFSGSTLASVRSIQIRQVQLNSNRIAAMAKDRATTAAIADLTIGLEGEAAAFTTISSGTLSSAGGIRVASFSVAEMESGAFGVCATYDASLAAGGSTVLSITGEVTYTISSESEGTSGSGTTSLEGTNAEHTKTRANNDAYAGILLKNDGNEYAYGADGTEQGTLLSAWLDSGSVDSLYAYASLTSGVLSVDSGTQEWLVCSNNRKWAAIRSSNGTATAAIELRIATDSAGSNVIDTANYTLTSIRTGVQLRGTAPQHSTARELANCVAGVSLNSSGVEYAYSSAGSATGTNLGSWLQGGVNSDFYVRCTVLTGTLSGGTEDTWEVMSSTRGYYITDTAAGPPKQTTIRLEIDTVGDGSNVVATAAYYLEAERTTLE